jgi:hypothetical protein
VVESSIEKEDVLPNSMLRDVMVANPHTAQSLQLLSKLTNRNDPMPEYMIAQILAGRSIESLKTELEGQLAAHQMQKVRAMNGINRFFTESPADLAATDSLIALYQADNSLQSRYMLAWLHLNRAEYPQGQAVMNGIPTLISLSDDEAAEYQDMQTLFLMLKSVFETGNNIFDISPVQISQVQNLEANANGFASVYARNILIALDEIEYEEPVVLPDQFKSSAMAEAYHKIMDAEAPKMMEVYPNPGKDFVILGYRLENETAGRIEIRDMSGTLLKNISFNGKQDQVTVTTATWAPGTYLVNLVVGEENLETLKFTLIK